MSPTIHVEQLSRTFSLTKKQPGLLGSLKGLIKPVYEEKEAVKGVSFAINEGELVGFIGPNGAGKTTTLKMLSGLLYPTSGSVRVLGHNPWTRDYEFLRQISLVMGQKNQLWWDLPAIESFNLIRDIYDIPLSRYKNSLRDLTSLLEIEDILEVQVRKLSLGQRMKAELVAALIHSPRVLYLDEPTIGLDVVMQQGVRSFLKEYNQRGDSSILLTSHYMDDVKELCQRVIIIDEGSILYDGLLSNVIAKFSKHKIIEVITPSGTTTHKVARSSVAEKAAVLLKDPAVIDINIKEIEIEDVIRQVFAGKQ